MRGKTRDCSILVILCWQKEMVILCWHRILPISALSPFAIQAFITIFRSSYFPAFLPKTSSQPTHLQRKVAKKGRKLNNKSRLSGFAVVNYHLQSGEKKRLIGVCVLCQPCLVQQVVWPGTPCTPGLRGRGRTWRSRERS